MHGSVVSVSFPSASVEVVSVSAHVKTAMWAIACEGPPSLLKFRHNLIPPTFLGQSLETVVSECATLLTRREFRLWL